ncbi:TPA: glycerol-3-phosphate 1-O-acyltransferase PlsY [Staphylococcus aureus]|uniref:Glycerol-3-phosphate acyltransferase n=1 Tax=Staphylococcus aureus (strain bovine RF122 / ET3-1) TaxID=273036 RepID=PLSY_STAAB|nr:glycerol-3-phosphate 1-O-acyltransferase PlsY [Staphylococcus aureus]Q2YXW4.1 RecName: Full=Glycerol-3-phosphate acyltransferase; AltName: Full=Acyl-PO4 G3P acyltransferase; AltName: Full=Acyl-phosphate--glycerol-3-phosphate acyltransferase; AltName: Full=G3P acyltransferase; Short=GPAT; AltName: Full=Lysophosphatidic acid synthase; Short=LPA synthase [Staphylococcus aureus RF122]MBI0976737.1 glycerol-3-phosphate 1-O-acyltransferase PlsY [Staphylococcus aureus]MBU9753085.1 glycerol-3-phosphat
MMIIVMLLLSYLIGAFPSGFVIGKLFFKKDIRQFGSGNTGATNSFRVLGRPAGFLVTFLDIFKGFITVFFPLWLPVHADGPISTFFTNGLIVGLFAILGHVYPVYLKFQGGKAVATSAGVVLGVNPILLLILAIIFFIILKIFKYVSLASIVAAICCVIGSLIIQDYILLVVSFLVSIILIIRHRSNIARIFRGEEPKIKWM